MREACRVTAVSIDSVLRATEGGRDKRQGKMDVGGIGMGEMGEPLSTETAAPTPFRRPPQSRHSAHKIGFCSDYRVSLISNGPIGKE